MKRSLLIMLFIIALISTTAFAEVKQGDVLIGASSQLSFSTTKVKPEGYSEEKVKSTNFDISAERLLTCNVSLGASLTYDKDDYDDGDTTATIILIYGTAYIQPNEKLNPYVTLGVGRIDMDFDGIDGDGLGFGGGIGILYFFNNNIALDFGFTYLNGELDVEGVDVDYTSSVFGAGFKIKF
ncbi:MAG: outer membrane beta-barrel protein [bacterium]